jgi:hypothetical protein
VSKFTAGPWEVREVDGLFAVAHRDGWVLESNDEQQDRADARLIAAAPELLEALQQCLQHIELDESMHGRPFGAGNVAREAIKKATGE